MVIPAPLDTLLGMYHPWRDAIWNGLTAGVPFKNFLITDPVRQLIPWKWLTMEIFKTGQLPLWNPYSFAGTPLLANFQTGAFYPLNLLFLLFNFPFAWTLFIFSQWLLGFVFMFLFLRNLRISRIAAAFGGGAWLFCGFWVSWFEWGNVLHTLLWLPALLWSIDKIFATLGYRRFLFCILYSLFFILSFFAGHPQTFIYVYVASALYFFIRGKQLSFSIIRLSVTFLLTTCCLLLATVVQWLPSLQFFNLSARSTDIANTLTRPDWFLPFSHLAMFFAPDFFGHPATLNYFGIWNYAEFVGYIGVIPLIFAVFAIFFRRDKKTLFFTFLTLFTLLFALPTPLAKVPFFLNVPFLATAQPSRLLCLTDFSLIILATLGLDFFLKQSQKILRVLFLFGIVYVSLFVFSFLNHNLISLRNLVFPFVIFILSSVVIFLFSKQKVQQAAPIQYPNIPISQYLTRRFQIPNSLKKNFLLILLFFLVVFDLGRFFLKFTPFTQSAWFYPSTQTTKFLQENLGYYRFMSLDRRIMPPNVSIMYHLQDVAGYDPLYLRAYAQTITKMESSDLVEPNQIGTFGRILTPTNYSNEIANLLGIKFVLSLSDLNDLKLVFREGETRVYENLKVKPRSFFENQTTASAAIIKYTPNEVIIRTQNPNPGKLILTDNYYPTWRAFIDNQPVHITQEKYNFRGILVPAGTHEVVFRIYLW